MKKTERQKKKNQQLCRWQATRVCAVPEQANRGEVAEPMKGTSERLITACCTMGEELQTQIVVVVHLLHIFPSCIQASSCLTLNCCNL